MPQNGGSLQWHLPGCSPWACFGHGFAAGFSWSSDRIEDFIVNGFRVKHKGCSSFCILIQAPFKSIELAGIFFLILMDP